MLRVIAFAIALFSLTPAARAEAPALYVFAAASLTDALSAVGQAYGEREGADLRLVFESSSTLARQIENGAPADLYFSANPRWMDYAEARGLVATATRRDLLANALALVAPTGRAPAGDALADPDALLSALGARGRLVMGDPDHVPAGMYGRQALESLGLWETVAPRVARAANVRAALALVSRGEAPLGLVYRTDALIDPDVEIAANVPSDAHGPIRYPAAITADTAADPNRRPAAERFLAFLAGEQAGAIFARFGFTRPDAARSDGADG
ncbi:MAG: molybdate ABC transporter substrate-binding protein [Marivibrio sp.]|uniref:molybdate ABC transporter substrate-binding protein n=1 Tax=Marivibrio sp. TaxID=2039719 RepID=UPI0032EE5034